MQGEDTTTNDPTKQSAEARARAEAQARRQKILEEAAIRMDVVTGVVPAGHAVVSEDVLTATDEVEADASLKSSKLAEMRRRRFKKKTIPKKEEDSNGDAIDGAQSEIESSTGTSQDKSMLQETISGKSRQSISKLSSEEEIKEEVGSSSHQKKYMGVAKMRRKMIKDRQSKEEEEAKAGSTYGTRSLSNSGPILAKLAAKKNRKGSIIPIVTHLLTVLLLFLGGLNIGLQQSRVQYSQPGLLVVHREITLLRRLEDVTSGRILESLSPTVKRVVIVVDDHSVLDDVRRQMDSEFEDVPVLSEEEKLENIDPLFQVDLDKYTEGEGIFMMAGRLAVYCHRMNLSMFYYFPLSLFQRVKAALLALVQCPPMLFLLALAVRQAIGKLILGANLPDISDEDKQGKDIIDMVKNFAKSFVLRAFPTAASLYDAWLHLRSDMYIILCGLFVGIAWHHQLQIISTTSDSTYPFVEPTQASGVETPPTTSQVADESTFEGTLSDEF